MHVLVIPREHHATLGALATSDLGLLGRVVTAAHTLAGQEGLIGADGAKSRWWLMVNTGPAGGQVVEHVHVHVLGGRQIRWPPGGPWPAPPDKVGS